MNKKLFYIKKNIQTFFLRFQAFKKHNALKTERMHQYYMKNTGKVLYHSYNNHDSIQKFLFRRALGFSIETVTAGWGKSTRKGRESNGVTVFKIHFWSGKPYLQFYCRKGISLRI